MSETPLPEPLQNFLHHPPALPASADAREALYKRTATMLPRRRGWRRWPVFGGIAASILLALAAAYFGLRSADTRPEIVERKSGPAAEMPKAVPPKEGPQGIAAVVPVRPLDLEWAAFDTQDDQQRGRLYFQAGDLYLERYNDFE